MGGSGIFGGKLMNILCRLLECFYGSRASFAIVCTLACSGRYRKLRNLLWMEERLAVIQWKQTPWPNWIDAKRYVGTKAARHQEAPHPFRSTGMKMPASGDGGSMEQ